MVAINQRIGFQIIGGILTLISEYSIAQNTNEIDMPHGSAQLISSVVSTPCSIAMQNRYQTVDFTPLKLTILSSKLERERHNQPFYIELRDCGNIYSSIDSKAWTIRFDGQSVEQINAFVLQGPSQGLGVSVLDNAMKILIPGQNYPLFDNVLQQGKFGQTFYLRYFLRLELTGKPIQAGNYQGLIGFFINYQ